MKLICTFSWITTFLNESHASTMPRSILMHKVVFSRKKNPLSFWTAAHHIYGCTHHWGLVFSIVCNKSCEIIASQDELCLGVINIAFRYSALGKITLSCYISYLHTYSRWSFLKDVFPRHHVHCLVEVLWMTEFRRLQILFAWVFARRSGLM